MSYNFSAVNINKIQTTTQFIKPQSPEDMLFLFSLESRKSIKLPTQQGSIHYCALLALFCWHKVAVNALLEAVEAIRDPQNILQRRKIGPLFIWKILSLLIKALCTNYQLSQLKKYGAFNDRLLKWQQSIQMLTQASLSLSLLPHFLSGILLKTILKHILDARKPSYHQKMVMYSTVSTFCFSCVSFLQLLNAVKSMKFYFLHEMQLQAFLIWLTLDIQGF